jgi:arylsulfatase A-like enzyme
VLLWWFACREEPRPPEDRPAPVGEPALEFADGRRPRDLLFLSFDTTRRDHVEPWSTDGVVRADFLASKFAGGVTLDDHVQCSNWTYASTSCTLRGRLMEETGFYPKLGEATRKPLPDGQPTLARRLAAEGWDTVMMSPNEWLSPTWNNAQGYAEFLDLPSGDARSVLARALVELRERWDLEAPWFVHVHFMEPHPPYVLHEGYTDEIDALPPAPASWKLDEFGDHYRTTGRWKELDPEERRLLERHLEARYTAEIRYLDDQLEAWWATIEAEGYLDDTLVVLWNDHGEQFFEHREQAHAHHLIGAENDGFAAFLAPDLTPARWTPPTHSVDLVPTVLDAMGLPAEGDPELPGYVLGTAPPDRPRFAATVAREGPLVSVILDDRKLMYDLEQGRLELYDRRTDRGELTNVYDPDHPMAARLWSYLEPRASLLEPLVPEFDVRRRPKDPPADAR